MDKSNGSDYKKGYRAGHFAGTNIKTTGQSFDRLITRNDRIRKEFNKRIKIAVDTAIEEYKTASVHNANNGVEQ